MNPKVSIIMPVYNGEKYLKLAIESILSQTYQNFEFIIINDGSTDATEEIIRSFNDHRIVYIKNLVNLRLIKSLNKGIEYAKGKYIARMDADDVSLPFRIEKQVNVLDHFEGVTLVNSRANKLSENGDIGGLLYFYANFEAIKYINMFSSIIIHPAIMIRSSVLKQYMYSDNIDNEHIEDIELWNRLLLSGHICYTINESLLLYRNNPSGICNSWDSLQKKRLKNLSIKLVKEYLEFSIDEHLVSILFGDASKIKYNDLNKLNNTLDDFVKIIIKKNVVSDAAITDLYYWKKYSILKSGFRMLIKGNLKNKIKAFLFLISKCYWIRNYYYFMKKLFG